MNLLKNYENDIKIYKYEEGIDNIIDDILNKCDLKTKDKRTYARYNVSKKKIRC